MLTDEQKVRIRENDILSDWDEVVINKHSGYIQALAYFSYLSLEKKIKFTIKSIEKYFEYIKNGDVRAFYEIFAGCPVEVLDKAIYKCTQKEKWNHLVEKLKVGIVSMNNHRIILKHLNLNLEKFKKQNTEVNIVAANEPESKNGSYTGNVEIKVNNNNLVDFVKEKNYIGGEAKKKILEDFGIYSIKVEDGLYICSKRKIF